jgi:hypothetical protein
MRLELFFKRTFSQRKHAWRQLPYSHLMIEVPSAAQVALDSVMTGRRAVSGRLFLSQQLQKHLPLGIIFGFSESPFEDDQVFAVYEFFHSVLLSMGRSFNLVTSSHGQQATARAVAMLLHRNVLIR